MAGKYTSPYIHSDSDTNFTTGRHPNPNPHSNIYSQSNANLYSDTH